ncbi:MAG: apolipoprotein A1/A4/E family protein, partial [Bradyrhizobiaceae bacterium]|nr:apolipoprotein A1/A4/E family protein [Bradyrhizobiaceae bacterium]
MCTSCIKAKVAVRLSPARACAAQLWGYLTMVTFSNKGEPNKADDDLPAVVRAAIDQEAPDLRDTQNTPLSSKARPAPVKQADGRRPAPEISLNAPLPDEGDHAMVRTRKDDLESIGQIMEALERRPSRMPFVIASLFTALWAIATAALVYGFGGHIRQMADEAGLAPTVIGLCGAFGAPVVFFFALASMIARLNELRIVSGTMAEATVRFAQPETAAHDSIMSIGQAIRREVAAMGDGVERALARAVELESLVNNEVSVLERAYSDNEVRIRNLLAGLAQQREILVGQAEQVRNAITHVHLDLSSDITTVSELIAERVHEAAQRVTQALADKGEQITIALGAAGDTMIGQLGDRGSNLLKEIATTSETATQAIDAAGERMKTSLNFKADQIGEQVRAITANLQQAIASRLDEAVGGFSQKSASVLATVESHTRELSSTITARSEEVSQSLIETAGRIAETIASRADEANQSLKTTSESIILDLDLHGNGMVSKLEGIGRTITESIVAVNGQGNALLESLAQRTAEMQELVSGAIATRDDALAAAITGRIEEANTAFAARATKVADTVEGQVARLEELLVGRVGKAV